MLGNGFLCSTCCTTFNTDLHRREHMRSGWHVNNLKRRVEGLSSINLEDYDSRTTPVESDNEFTDSTSDCADSDYDEDDSTDCNDDPDDDKIPFPEQCLFCQYAADDINENILHMSTSHSFYIPKLDGLQIPLATFVGYLSIVINKHHSCLYCNHTKHSAEAIRAHMLAKGHQMLDLEPESRFLEFWRRSPGSEPGTSDNGGNRLTLDDQTASNPNLRLPSGSLASSRHSRKRTRAPGSNPFNGDTSSLVVRSSDNNNSTSLSPQTHPSNNPRQSQTLSKRDAMGVTGLSTQHQRQLLATQQKLRSSEFRATSRHQWTLEKIGNKQKHFHVRPVTRVPDSC